MATLFFDSNEMTGKQLHDVLQKAKEAIDEDTKWLNFIGGGDLLANDERKSRLNPLKIWMKS